jgi:hypothetical protein
VSLLQVLDAQGAGIGGELDTLVLQDAIDEEEAWLARRIGQLVGERTERLSLAYLSPRTSEVHLQRPTDEVAVKQDGVTLATVELRPAGWLLANLPEGARFTGILEATYTPTDMLEVRRAIKQLLGLALSAQSAGGLTGETMGTYSYQRSAGTSAKVRAAIVRSLQEPGSAGTTRLRSSVRHGLAGALER